MRIMVAKLKPLLKREMYRSKDYEGLQTELFFDGFSESVTLFYSCGGEVIAATVGNIEA